MKKIIHQAVEHLLNGEIVAIPTETVYGLGADSTDNKAVQKIFALKGRPSFNPLIIHVYNLDQALNYGHFNEVALKLAKKFWPGPLTLVAPLKPNTNISGHVTAGLSSIGIRCPSHPVALEILKHYPNPIAAPSANRSGYISPTKYEHVYDEFGDQIFIVPGGQSDIGLESTIIDCSTSEISILRPGFITHQDIESTLGCKVNKTTTTKIIKAPGQLESHYAPNLPVRLNAADVFPNEVLLSFGTHMLTPTFELNLSKSANLEEAAINLFDYLRRLDKMSAIHGITGIAVMPIPNQGTGIAINERLARAAYDKSKCT